MQDANAAEYASALQRQDSDVSMEETQQLAWEVVDATAGLLMAAPHVIGPHSLLDKVSDLQPGLDKV